MQSNHRKTSNFKLIALRKTLIVKLIGFVLSKIDEFSTGSKRKLFHFDDFGNYWDSTSVKNAFCSLSPIIIEVSSRIIWSEEIVNLWTENSNLQHSKAEYLHQGVICQSSDVALPAKMLTIHLHNSSLICHITIYITL